MNAGVDWAGVISQLCVLWNSSNNQVCMGHSAFLFLSIIYFYPSEARKQVKEDAWKIYFLSLSFFKNNFLQNITTFGTISVKWPHTAAPPLLPPPPVFPFSLPLPLNFSSIIFTKTENINTLKKELFNSTNSNKNPMKILTTSHITL